MNRTLKELKECEYFNKSMSKEEYDILEEYWLNMPKEDEVKLLDFLNSESWSLDGFAKALINFMPDDIETFILCLEDNLSGTENTKATLNMTSFLREYCMYIPGDRVDFIPRTLDCENLMINKTNLSGRITKLKFTEAKVFYDIVDDFWGYMFKNVPSENVVSKLKKQ